MVNINIPNTTEEKQGQISPEKLLGMLRRELVSKGMAVGNVDRYIIQNKERLGIDKKVISLIEGNPLDVSEGQEEKIEPEVSKEKSSTILDVETELKKQKEEMSKEEKGEGIKSQTAEEEKQDVEQKTVGESQILRPNIKIDGYNLSSVVSQNSKNISLKGDVHESKTWQAMLIERIEEIWGDVRGLFSAK